MIMSSAAPSENGHRTLQQAVDEIVRLFGMMSFSEELCCQAAIREAGKMGYSHNEQIAWQLTQAIAMQCHRTVTRKEFDAVYANQREKIYRNSGMVEASLGTSVNANVIGSSRLTTLTDVTNGNRNRVSRTLSTRVPRAPKEPTPASSTPPTVEALPIEVVDVPHADAIDVVITEVVEQVVVVVPSPVVVKRGRGRPPGSRNKPKGAAEETPTTKEADDTEASTPEEKKPGPKPREIEEEPAINHDAVLDAFEDDDVGAHEDESTFKKKTDRVPTIYSRPIKDVPSGPRYLVDEQADLIPGTGLYLNDKAEPVDPVIPFDFKAAKKKEEVTIDKDTFEVDAAITRALDAYPTMVTLDTAIISRFCLNTLKQFDRTALHMRAVVAAICADRNLPFSEKDWDTAWERFATIAPESARIPSPPPTSAKKMPVKSFGKHRVEIEPASAERVPYKSMLAELTRPMSKDELMGREEHYQEPPVVQPTGLDKLLERMSQSQKEDDEEILPDEEYADSDYASFAHGDPEAEIKMLAQCGIDPVNPTDTKPGTDEKVVVLAARYAAGLPLWHKDDKNDFSPPNRRKDHYRDEESDD